MRVGRNPEKSNIKINTDTIHRIIIPVYLPNLTDPYFKDGLKILKLCITSLLKTIHYKSRISIINNGCCEAVVNYLQSIYNNEPYVDELFNSKQNLGKINAIYSVVKSCLEPIITVTDADVMFLNGWQNATESILDNFPEAGMVSPVPASIAYESGFNNSTIYYALFKGKLEFSKVLNPEGMLNFQRSIDRIMYNKHHLENYLTVNNGKSKAVLGCGHFVATYRAEVFENAPANVCKDKIGGRSLNDYIDLPNDNSGFLRLATLDNYAYHLGNVIEDWMFDVDKSEIKRSNLKPLAILSKVKPLKRHQYFIGKVLHRLCFIKFRTHFFKFKGLSKEAAQNY